MNNPREILHLLYEDDSPDSKQKKYVSLENLLTDQLLEQPWFANIPESVGQKILSETGQLIAAKIEQLKSKQLDPSLLDKSLEEISSNLMDHVFFTPIMVRFIYSDHPAEMSTLVHAGAEKHYQIIRRASSFAVRRHLAGLKRVSLDPLELEEELWGVVMEELVRTMSDSFARIWNKKVPKPLVFPTVGTRGSKQGIMLRVALSKNGNRLAAYRSDKKMFVWDINTKELVHLWNMGEQNRSKDEHEPESIFFSRDGTKIALATKVNKIMVLSIKDSNAGVGFYGIDDQQKFKSEFGEPFIKDRTLDGVDGFNIQSKSGQEIDLISYSRMVYDWNMDDKKETFASASEMDRIMPEWMQKAGFERAVFHITKKRLIDLIRKRTHTLLACWRCGSTNSNLSDTQCRQCGADFSRCPIGCTTHEPLCPGNRWQCPRCSMVSRVAEPLVEVEVEDWLADSRSIDSQWRDEHDMERILKVLHRVSITYKKQEIPCDRVVVLKSEGKTNEEIGKELGIPRGSVDYVWNQCKQQIILSFGEI